MSFIRGDLYIVAVYDTTLTPLIFAKVAKMNGLCTGELVAISQKYESDDNEYWKQRIGSKSLTFLRWEPFYNRYNKPHILCEKNNKILIKIRKCHIL